MKYIPKAKTLCQSLKVHNSGSGNVKRRGFRVFKI